VDDAGQATTVSEGCVIEATDNASIVVKQAPIWNGDAVIPADRVQVRWTVTAVDPSGNETVVACSTGLDLSDRDRDNDGIVDASDNCPDDPNEDQLDSDFDQVGDVCDDTPYDGLLAEGSGGCGAGAGGTSLMVLLGVVVVLGRRRRAM
jgi:uncharacterized protein (TIGR03382 family)